MWIPFGSNRPKEAHTEDANEKYKGVRVPGLLAPIKKAINGTGEEFASNVFIEFPEIQAAIDKCISVENKLKETEDLITHFKKLRHKRVIKLVEKIAAKISKQKHPEAWASNLYWTDETISRIVQEAFKLAFNGRKLVPAAMQIEMPCNACGNITSVLCRSWHLARNGSKGWNGLCAKCVEDKRSKRREEFENYKYKEIEWQKEQKLLATMPYSEYLQTEHWKDIRIRALRKAGFRCQLCNNEGKLDVHHRTYERRGCEWSTDVIALCRKCHSKFHGK